MAARRSRPTLQNTLGPERKSDYGTCGHAEAELRAVRGVARMLDRRVGDGLIAGSARFQCKDATIFARERADDLGRAARLLVHLNRDWSRTESFGYGNSLRYATLREFGTVSLLSQMIRSFRPSFN